MSLDVDYPLIPTSEHDLRAGQFWSIPLSDGRYGCGVVMEVDQMENVDYFHGVLLDWVGRSRPTVQDVVAATEILGKRSCGVLAITVGDGQIEGQVDVDDLHVSLPEEVVGPATGPIEVYRGSRMLRQATDVDRASLQPRGMGSIGSFRVSAERNLVTTRRLIALWRPHPEVNQGKLQEVFSSLGETEYIGGRLGSMDGEKVFYAVNPKRRQFIGDAWYEGPAAPHLAEGYAPFVFDYAPGSDLFKRALSATVERWEGYVDNGTEPIMTTQEFQERYPPDSPWPFADTAADGAP